MKLTKNRVTRYLGMQKRVNDLLMKMKAPTRADQMAVIKICAILLEAEQNLRELQQRMTREQEVK